MFPSEHSHEHNATFHQMNPRQLLDNRGKPNVSPGCRFRSTDQALLPRVARWETASSPAQAFATPHAAQPNNGYRTRRMNRRGNPSALSVQERLNHLATIFGRMRILR